MICDVQDIKNIRSISDNIRDMSKILPFIYEAEHLDVMPVISPAVYKMLDENMIDGVLISVNDGQIIAEPTGNFLSMENDNRQRVEYTKPVKYTYKYLTTSSGKIAVTSTGHKIILDKQIEIEPEIDLTDIYYEYYYNNACGHHEGLITVIAYFAYARLLESANVNVTAFGAVTKISEYSQPVFTPALKIEANNARNIAKTMFHDVVEYLWQRSLNVADQRIYLTVNGKIVTNKEGEAIITDFIDGTAPNELPHTLCQGKKISSVNIFAI